MKFGRVGKAPKGPCTWMLSSLVIRNIVLIRHLDLTFCDGLCVLTGETGAGKSIFVDALGLALGARADARLVRHGSSEASVTASFQIPPGHNLCNLLVEQSIEFEESDILLRRVLKADGHSRAFINDQPVSIALLRKVGDTLVEIHGQFQNQKLLRPNTHREILDEYGDYDDLKVEVKTRFNAWKKIVSEKIKLEAVIKSSEGNAEYLCHVVGELEALKPQQGEEDELAKKRRMIMNTDEIAIAINEALEQFYKVNGIEESLQRAARVINNIAYKTEGQMDNAILALDQTINESTEVTSILEKIIFSLNTEPEKLEQVEERLFALRGLARKHGVQVEDLPNLRKKMHAKLKDATEDNKRFEELTRIDIEAKSKYLNVARKLTLARRQTALALDKEIKNELKGIEMIKSNFVTKLIVREEDDWTREGADEISFLISTSPGVPLGPLTKIASGGEMSRFMLSIQVVLANTDCVSAMVFDEVDSGIGGAVASAVGERLVKLSRATQVLVVTHSPQVAAKGVQHLRVSKEVSEGKIGGDEQFVTDIVVLTENQREEEIARMLSGRRITEEARAAATSLLARS